jgi:hypothetical protein
MKGYQPSNFPGMSDDDVADVIGAVKKVLGIIV